MLQHFVQISRRIVVLSLATVLLIAGAVGVGYLVVEFDGNIHPIEDGVAYRSAQLDGNQLRNLASQVGIRSIINLRGSKPGKHWYEDEVAVADELGIHHVDYGLSASSPLTIEQMMELQNLFERMPKPILIHCKAGADRTGLASALYLAAKGRGDSDIRSALSIRYGHFPFFDMFDKTGAMDDSLELFLKQRSHLTTNNY